MKTKKPRKPGKKPGKRKHAKPRTVRGTASGSRKPVPKKTSKKSRRPSRSTVKRALGRANGFLPTLRKHYEDARDAVERKYLDARARLGSFYDENRDTIHTAAAVAAAAAAAAGLGYGAYRLAQDADVREYVDNLQRSLRSRWGNYGGTGGVSPRVVHPNRGGVNPEMESLLAGTPRPRTSLASQIADDEQLYTDYIARSGLPSSRTPRPTPRQTPPSTARGPRPYMQNNTRPYTLNALRSEIDSAAGTGELSDVVMAPWNEPLPPESIADLPKTPREVLYVEYTTPRQAQMDADAQLARELQRQQQLEDEAEQEFLALNPTPRAHTTTPRGLVPPQEDDPLAAPPPRNVRRLHPADLAQRRLERAARRMERRIQQATQPQPSAQPSAPPPIHIFAGPMGGTYVANLTDGTYQQVA
jgi:hypothetical protein